MDKNDYMMWLSRALGYNKKIFNILKCFGSPEEVYNSKRETYLTVKGITDEVADKLISAKKNAEKWCDELKKLNIEYISLLDDRYPSLLRETCDAPVGIYVKGQLPKKNEHCISMIGARRCSEYGKRMAKKFSSEIAREGVWIVSGMARGIDSVSHRGTLSVGGKTIAVLGFGHNRCYPSENRELMKQISETGCVLSEYPPDTEPEVYYFPQRNRIIAGISEALIVIEAGKKSGTLITVDRALDYGRTVMTIPSNITSMSGVGTNELIKQGCPVVTSADDVFFEIGIEKKKKDEKKKVNISDDEAEIFNLLSLEPKLFDEIVKKSQKSIQDVQYILTMLEINGLIEKLAGNRFVKKN
ncbi:MAG: DNA-processing protein DprA [Clostridia bacterium]|nr:DNA-processing protein DprA [Clostridia bacterium]